MRLFSLNSFVVVSHIHFVVSLMIAYLLFRIMFLEVVTYTTISFNIFHVFLFAELSFCQQETYFVLNISF